MMPLRIVWAVTFSSAALGDKNKLIVVLGFYHAFPGRIDKMEISRLGVRVYTFAFMPRLLLRKIGSGGTAASIFIRG